MRYPFRCTACGLDFEVSRPARDAAAAAFCPADGAPAERVFTAPEMSFNRPPSAAPAAPPSRGYSHSGHSHGPGTAHHAH
jgi:putative FmdB family regulatory protein